MTALSLPENLGKIVQLRRCIHFWCVIHQLNIDYARKENEEILNIITAREEEEEDDVFSAGMAHS
jgi:hypothetical protein